MGGFLLWIILIQFSLDFNEPNTDIGFIDFGEIEVFQARCVKDQKRILIDKNHWDSIPFVHKRELVYHELLHCDYNLKHEDETNTFYKNDIMQWGDYATKKDGSNWRNLVSKVKKRIKRTK